VIRAISVVKEYTKRLAKIFVHLTRQRTLGYNLDHPNWLWRTLEDLRQAFENLELKSFHVDFSKHTLPIESVAEENVQGR
jgi:hypothetical protein